MTGILQQLYDTVVQFPEQAFTVLASQSGHNNIAEGFDPELLALYVLDEGGIGCTRTGRCLL